MSSDDHVADFEWKAFESDHNGAGCEKVVMLCTDEGIDKVESGKT